jgi:DNA-binding FadR family transcriptional regulator
MSDEIRRGKIRDQVADRLQDFISSKRLVSGDRLPTENELATKFGVSRLSVREATKSLEFMGILHSKPGWGLSVGQVNLERIAELMAFHPTMRLASRTQLIETRIVIETGVLPHVMQSMQERPQVYESLSEIVQQMRSVRSLAQFIELDVAFHRGLIEASQLSPLLAFNELLVVFFKEFRESVKRAEFPESVDSHQRLIDYLRDQDLPAACKELKTHIESHKFRG